MGDEKETKLPHAHHKAPPPTEEQLKAMRDRIPELEAQTKKYDDILTSSGMWRKGSNPKDNFDKAKPTALIPKAVLVERPSDGKVVLAGRSEYISGAEYRNAVVMVTANEIKFKMMDKMDAYPDMSPEDKVKYRPLVDLVLMFNHDIYGNHLGPANAEGKLDEKLNKSGLKKISDYANICTGVNLAIVDAMAEQKEKAAAKLAQKGDKDKEGAKPDGKATTPQPSPQDAKPPVGTGTGTGTGSSGGDGGKQSMLEPISPDALTVTPEMVAIVKNIRMLMERRALAANSPDMAKAMDALIDQSHTQLLDAALGMKSSAPSTIPFKTVDLSKAALAKSKSSVAA